MYHAIYEISPLEKATALVSFFQNMFFAAPTSVAANTRACKFNQLPLGAVPNRTKKPYQILHE